VEAEGERSERSMLVKAKTKVKAGKLAGNHNTVVR
jgi:hypothetical protein